MQNTESICLSSLRSQPWERCDHGFRHRLYPNRRPRLTRASWVIVDRLTKMAIYLPCRKDVDSPELARMFFEEVICKHGVPSNIVTDRGSQFTSRFWNRVCSHLSIDHRLSTSFHPQTDGQTERQNQTMEQYLRAFATYEQDNWVDLLPLAEFAYNNSVHATTRLTPFFANYGYHPEMHFKPPKDARFRSERAADERLGKLQAARSGCGKVFSRRRSVRRGTRAAKCHGVGRDINVQCVFIRKMIIIVDHYTLAVRNRR
jgi:hypothetical protein